MTEIADAVEPPQAEPRSEEEGGLVAEWARAGNWLFRRRSHLPLVALLFLLWVSYSAGTPSDVAGRLDGWEIAGLAVGFLGLALRGWTVGHAPKGTSHRGTRKPEASRLNTEGIYSVVRHPLYLGNYLLWFGVSLTTGSPWAVAITALVFWIYNDRIMLAEERFLRGKFGRSFDEWASRTRALVPRFGDWRPHPLPFSLRFALGRDVSAFYALVAATTALEASEVLGSSGGFELHAFWWTYLGAGTVAYVLLVALKKAGMLEVEGR